MNSRTGHGGLVTAFCKNLIVIIVIFYTEKLVSDLFHESKTKQTNIVKLGRHMYLSLDEGVQSLGSPDSNWAPMYSDQIVFRNK